MAYPFEEHFASGIPPGFASNGGGGGITATWNAGQQAADPVFNHAQNYWRLTDAPLSTDFWFEMDMEIVEATYTPPHFGFWLWTGMAAYEGHRLCVHNGQWLHSFWWGSGYEEEKMYAAWAGWALLGARRTLRLAAKRYADPGAWLLQLSVDGETVWRALKRWHTALRPCIFGYGITLRLHRVAGDTGSGLPEALPMRHRGLSAPMERLCLSPSNAAAQFHLHRGLRPLLGLRNHYYHGGHGIAGSVKRRIQGVVADEPLRRRVLLIDEANCIVVRETWSDATTGAYSFDHIGAEPRYLVIAFDHEGRHRAVVADNLRAQPMREMFP